MYGDIKWHNLEIIILTHISNYLFLLGKKKKVAKSQSQIVKRPSKAHGYKISNKLIIITINSQSESLLHVIANKTPSSNHFSDIKPESNFCSNQCIYTCFLDSNLQKLSSEGSIFHSHKALLDGRPIRHFWREHLHFGIIPKLGGMRLCFLSQA